MSTRSKRTRKKRNAYRPSPHDIKWKPIPRSLYSAYKKIADNDWEDEELYEKFIEKAREYLGDKAEDRINMARLVVLLSRVRSGAYNLALEHMK